MCNLLKLNNKIKKIGVLTSGGDAPGMNAAIRSVVRTCAYHNIDCVGIFRGYDGIIEGLFQPMNARSVKGIINKGGTILKFDVSAGSCIFSIFESDCEKLSKFIYENL